jgi:hypothetical protein
MIPVILGVEHAITMETTANNTPVATPIAMAIVTTITIAMGIVTIITATPTTIIATPTITIATRLVIRTIPIISTTVTQTTVTRTNIRRPLRPPLRTQPTLRQVSQLLRKPPKRLLRYRHSQAPQQLRTRHSLRRLAE